MRGKTWFGAGTAAPTAIIDGGVLDAERTLIGEDTYVWNFAHVGLSARIGSRCTIGEGVHIAPSVVVGNGCKIQNGAQLFTGVTLEDDVFIGPHVVFTNVRTPRAFINRKAEFKPTLVKRGASIGANATIVCGVTIGEYAMIGAGSIVTRDVAAHALVYGTPAEPHGAICRCGATLQIVSWTTGVPGQPPTPMDHKCTACKTEYAFLDGNDGEIRAKAPTP